MWHIENLKYSMTEEYSKPCQISKLMRDILRTITYSEQLIEGNLRVRISDPWEKRVPRKMFEFFLGLKHPRLTTFILRTALLYSRSVLLFPEIYLVFQKCLYFFSKMPYCFSELL